ncbi:MAG TPA: NCS2 family permease [Anaerovoracaceae bacterium]|nr:NCS2 family permease [Anaerovoracaceae bacterium]
MEKYFELNKNNTDIFTEIFAGITTFLSMAYILAVNPAMLSDAGMDPGAVFTATAISAGFSTILMGIWSKYPIVLASGMGLNAYFTYSVCIPLAESGIDNPWQIALTAVFMEGIIFVILSLTKFRETLVNKVPSNIKYGITVGVGLFIALTGMFANGMIIKNNQTFISLGDLGSPEIVLSLLGFFIIVVLHHHKILGGILWGILLTWLMGIIAEKTGWYQSDLSLIPNFSSGFLPSAPYFFEFNWNFVFENTIQFIAIVFSFLYVDLFDTVGALIGIGEKANLMDKNDELPNAGQAFMSDALGTVLGSILGTSTVTSYIESNVGVTNGGRTGLTAISAGVMLLLALFLSPIFLAIPSFATAPALLYVGLMMMSIVKKMDFEIDMASAVSGFFAITIMPFTYSIENGIMFAILSFVIIRTLQGKAKDIHYVMWISSILFAIRIYTLIF